MTTLAHPDRLGRGHPFRQWKTWRIPGTDVTLTSYSRAAVSYAASFLRAAAELNHDAAYDPRLAGHRLHGVRQDDEFRLGRRAHHLRAHPQRHLPEQHQHR